MSNYVERIDYKNSSLFICISSMPINRYPSHGHNDLNSFILYVKKKPIFIDSGRYNYVASNYQENQISAYQHNSLTINNMEPLSGICSRKLPDAYSCVNVNTIKNIGDDYVSYEISHDGFKRLFFDKIEHVRKFILYSNRLLVIDKITAINDVIISQFLNLDQSISLININDNILKMRNEVNGMKYKLSYNAHDCNDQSIKAKIKSSDCIISPNYGEQKISQRIEFDTKCSKSFISNIEFSWI